MNPVILVGIGWEVISASVLTLTLGRAFQGLQHGSSGRYHA